MQCVCVCVRVCVCAWLNSGIDSAAGSASLFHLKVPPEKCSLGANPIDPPSSASQRLRVLEYKAERVELVEFSFGWNVGENIKLL